MEVMNPDPSNICIEDIGHGLSHVCRFGGHVRSFYSVAQHSCLVSRHAPDRLAVAALLHDAAEAFIGDVIHPLKQCLPDYKKIETIWERAIAQAFGLEGLTPSDHGVIKILDLAALITERRDVCCHGWDAEAKKNRWAVDKMGIKPWPETIHAMLPDAALDFFLDEWDAVNERVRRSTNA